MPAINIHCAPNSIPAKECWIISGALLITLSVPSVLVIFDFDRDIILAVLACPSFEALTPLVDIFAMIPDIVTTFYRKNRNGFMTMADALGLAAVVVLVFLTTCQVTSTLQHTAAANTNVTLVNHQNDYQSLLPKPFGKGWKTLRSRFVHYSSQPDGLPCCILTI